MGTKYGRRRKEVMAQLRRCRPVCGVEERRMRSQVKNSPQDVQQLAMFQGTRYHAATRPRRGPKALGLTEGMRSGQCSHPSRDHIRLQVSQGLHSILCLIVDMHAVMSTRCGACIVDGSARTTVQGRCLGPISAPASSLTHPWWIVRWSSDCSGSPCGRFGVFIAILLPSLFDSSCSKSLKKSLNDARA